MAAPPDTQDSWEMVSNVQLALLTIALIMAICMGVVRWTENTLKTEPIHRRTFTLPRLGIMFVGTDMVVLSQILLRGGLVLDDLPWQSTVKTLEGCGIAFGAMVVRQVIVGGAHLAVDRYEKRRRSVEDLEQQQDPIVVESVEEHWTLVVDPRICVRCEKSGVGVAS
ncbi:hypothetical protein LTR95_015332 [Oleoguttula sp. CCFEE 5521]